MTETRLCQVPTARQTWSLADAMADVLSDVLCGASARPGDVVGALGWRYREGVIGSADSTVESLLVPLLGGGFSVVVNAQRSPSPARALWLTAHEIGHSFFYVPGTPPRRIIAVTPEEERFCDEFADRLTAANRGFAAPVARVA
ncbi:hypothetical protein [Nocardioides caricicola]|uniref:ImmA/IrrE family metallo-endopeptidase n=1 Tax=Nocardioides caricicola TaxID=634770 RepID=A0ABW0MZ80_9ACTN